MNFKEITDILSSIDTSLQMIANANGGLTTAFISKKAMAQRLGVAPVVIDKLVHTGIASGGTAGLVEGRHYCKLDPTETNTRYFLFDATKVMADAWKSFTGYEQPESGENRKGPIRQERKAAASSHGNAQINHRGYRDPLSRVS